MTQSSSQALSQEIKQTAQKILRHLDEFEFDDDIQSNIKKESDLINLLSSLQTDESTNLLEDVNNWTEYRRDSYQKFVNPLLDQVESNQKMAEHETNEAIPILQSEMDEFDNKLMDAKSKLSLLSENVIHAASNAIEESKTKGPKIENPQLQLNIPQPSIEDINEKELSRIEYENEIIRQLKKRQEFFLNALQNFDKQIGAIQTDLKNSREDCQNLENENKKLKEELKMLGKRPQLLTGNEVRMEVDCSKIYLEINKSISFEIPFDEPKYTDKSQNTDESQYIDEIKYTNETKYTDESQQTDEKEDLKNEEKLNDKMAGCKIYFFTDENITLEPNDEYIIIPKSEADDYFNYIKSNDTATKNINNEDLDETENKTHNNGKYHYTSHDNINTNQLFDPSSITSEISYEIKTNEKGEVIFDLTDEIGNNILGSFSPESAEEIQAELQQDIHHLIAINANSSQLTTDQSNPNTASQTGDPLNPTNPFNVSLNRNPTFSDPNCSHHQKLKEKVNFTFGSHPFESPQPIVPIGIRPKEGQNGNLGFRFFFRQNDDALILDTEVKQRTKDGLAILNNPSPNILIRIEDGFSTGFVSRCRENPDFNFILRPYRPAGSKDKVVGLCENNRDSYRPNFFRENRNTPCVWSSFPVRPPPPIYRSPNRPQTNHLTSPTQRNSSLDAQTPHAAARSKEMPHLSPQQVYQMRKSSPSNIALRKSQTKTSQMARVRHSYNAASRDVDSGQIDSPSPRKMIQMKNGRRIISPDSKSRNLKAGNSNPANQRYNSLRKLNRPNEM